MDRVLVSFGTYFSDQALCDSVHSRVSVLALKLEEKSCIKRSFVTKVHFCWTRRRVLVLYRFYEDNIALLLYCGKVWQANMESRHEVRPLQVGMVGEQDRLPKQTRMAGRHVTHTVGVRGRPTWT